jgi:hypothetical protein
VKTTFLLDNLSIKVIRLYQLYGKHLFTGRCRFEPTCSNYAIQAVEKYGILKGFHLIVKRLMRCHPPYSGYDPP